MNGHALPSTTWSVWDSTLSIHLHPPRFFLLSILPSPLSNLPFKVRWNPIDPPFVKGTVGRIPERGGIDTR